MMKQLKKWFSTTTIVIFVVLVVGVVDFINRSKNSPIHNFDPARSKGNSQATLRIVEFVDFQCQECAKGVQILNDYLKRFPDDMYVTVKYYSLGQLNSTMSAVYAHCASEQNRFWDFHDALFQTQVQWHMAMQAEDFFRAYAQKLRMDLPKLKQCVEDDRIKAVLFEETALGASHFIKITPTYFINGKMVVGAEALEDYLFEALELKLL